MSIYTKPITDIIAIEVSRAILLEGSHDVEEFKDDKDPIVVGGDDANEFKKGLWDEE